MKLSISLPDAVGREIKMLAARSERHVSWWFQKAWDLARTQLLHEGKTALDSHRKFIRTMDSLRGALKDDFPDTDSVALAHQAFTSKKKS